MRSVLNENLDQVNADRERFSELAERAGSVAQEMNLAPTARAASGLAERARDWTFQLVFGGEFNSGKSTAINALLGQRVMPTAAVEASAILTYIRHGFEERALLYPLDGRAPIEVPVDKLGTHICVDPDDPDRELPWKYAELYLPLELLEQGVVVVDPPGTNNNDERTQKNVEAIKVSDAVVYLFFATTGLTAAQRPLISGDLAGKECFWLVTHADNLDGEDVQKVRSRLERDLRKVRPGDETVDSRIYFVNARGAQEAKANQNSGEFANSGMQDFETALGEFIAGDRHGVKMATLCADLIQVLTDLDESTGQRAQDVEDEWHRTQGECDAALMELQALESGISEAKNRLISVAERLVADIRDSVYSKVQQLPLDPSGISYGTISDKPTWFVFDDTTNRKIRDDVTSNVVTNTRKNLSSWFDTGFATDINAKMEKETVSFNEKLRAAKENLTIMQRGMALPHDQLGSVAEMPVRPIGGISDAITDALNRVPTPHVSGFVGYNALQRFNNFSDWDMRRGSAEVHFFDRVRSEVLASIADLANEISNNVQAVLKNWRKDIDQAGSLVITKPLLDIEETRKTVKGKITAAELKRDERLAELTTLREELSALHGELAVVQAGYATR